MNTVGQLRAALVEVGMSEYGRDGQINMKQGDHLVWLLFRWNAEESIMDSVAKSASRIITSRFSTILWDADVIVTVSAPFPFAAHISVRNVVHELYEKMEWADCEWSSNDGLGPFIGGFFVCPDHLIDSLNQIIARHQD